MNIQVKTKHTLLEVGGFLLEENELYYVCRTSLGFALINLSTNFMIDKTYDSLDEILDSFPNKTRIFTPNQVDIVINAQF